MPAIVSAPAPAPDAAPTDDYTGLDHTALEDGNVRVLSDGTYETWIAVDGMVCAACAQTIESSLLAHPGVRRAQVALMTQRAHVIWDGTRTPVSTLFRSIAKAGYSPYPADSAEYEAARRQRARVLLWRLLVAAFAMMQVMMYAAPEYFTAPGEIASDQIRLLRWAQWMMTLPVMLFCAWPILSNALHSLRQRSISMDLPAGLGIVLAFVASSAATFDGTGEVWFDSVTMFVFFLLLARWLENRARHRTTLRLEALRRQLPATVTRVVLDVDGNPVHREQVSPARLGPGDLVQVTAGEAFAADGIIVTGSTQADEALLTGESQPLDKPCGAAVRAGSVNLTQSVLIRVEHAASDSTLGQIRQLVDAAASTRPDWMRTADHWARYFLIGVLVLAAVGWGVWQFIDPTRALPVAIAILIVTCPCALSLATPAAMLAATSALARRGIWLRSPGALERLAQTDRIAFDKTGTLTTGLPTLDHIDIQRDGIDAAQTLSIAGALAVWSRHPLSRALAMAANSTATATDIHETAGGGITGTLNGQRYRLGSLAYLGLTSTDADAIAADPRPATWLADDQGLLARYTFDDTLRSDAVSALQGLEAAGVRVALLSGDAPQAVQRLAARVGIDDSRAALQPEDKFAIVRGWQDEGSVVAMVGDGINDGPALAGADVSISLGDAAPLAQGQSDLVLASGRLNDLAEARTMAGDAVRTMRTNLVWALSYNLAGVPLAAMGYMPPWLAGLGMALSSLLVIGNGMRLMRRPTPTRAGAPALTKLDTAH